MRGRGADRQAVRGAIPIHLMATPATIAPPPLRFDAELVGHGAHVGDGRDVLLVGVEVLDQEGRVGVQALHLGDEGAEVDAAEARAALGHVQRQVAGDRHVLGVHGADVRTELVEARADEAGVVVVLRRRVDHVHRIQVHGEALAVDGLQQREVAVRRVRQQLGHRLERVVAALGRHGVDDLAHAVDDQRERVALRLSGCGPSHVSASDPAMFTQQRAPTRSASASWVLQRSIPPPVWHRRGSGDCRQAPTSAIEIPAAAAAAA